MFASMLAATLVLASVALTQPAVDDAADRYIVVLEESVDHPSQVASGIEQRQDLEVGFVYSSALKGFSAEIPDQALAAVRANPQVAYIERDRPVYTAAQMIPLGIRRIGADQSSAWAKDGWPDEGLVSIWNVNAYVIDSGIYRTHTDLNVVHHVNRTKGENEDCHGHGTHVAGTVAAEDNGMDVVGVAPGARLTGVKVVGCDGFGSVSNAIAGVNWVSGNAKKPAIATISLSSGASKAFDSAVRNSVQSGVFYAVAAGNHHKNACNYSPARAGKAVRDTNGDGKINFRDSNGIVTTAATDSSDKEAVFSNYGPCVDLWAPGVDIRSTRKGGGTVYMSGTSMAAPHVGGTAALYLSDTARDEAKPVTVERALKAASEPTGTTSEDGRQIELVNARRY